MKFHSLLIPLAAALSFTPLLAQGAWFKALDCRTGFRAIRSEEPRAASEIPVPSSSRLEFKIPRSQVELAAQKVDHQFLAETFFILPNNDGEARRAVEILRAAGAPHLQVSHQAWGATLDKEDIPLSSLARLKRVVTFEMPGVEMEAKLRARGLAVVPIDHHSYQGLDRRAPESSLEQLMAMIRWPASSTDHALAVNDRGYIPGLKKLGLSQDEIRAIRSYDLVAQGRTLEDVNAAIKQAHRLIPTLPRRNGVFVLNGIHGDEAILKQELAIQSDSGVVNTFEIGEGRLGFSGDPKIAEKLLKTRFEDLGYAPGSFAQYGGGDPEASMFFGFKPKQPPRGERELIPRRILETIEALIMPAKNSIIAAHGTVNESEVAAAEMLPRGAAILTSSGALARQGIRHIIHAATGSMGKVGPKFDPTVKGVTDSLRNSLELARTHGDARVAIPFIGGKVFVERIGVSAQELADRIVESAIQNRGDLELRFVTFGDEDTRLFRTALAKYAAGLKPGQVALTPGSITDHALHGASAIINAANMEAQFGGGLSGAIGRATGDPERIDAEARAAVRGFYGRTR